jgi:hypothetical protein
MRTNIVETFYYAIKDDAEDDGYQPLFKPTGGRVSRMHGQLMQADSKEKLQAAYLKDAKEYTSLTEQNLLLVRKEISITEVS